MVLAPIVRGRKGEFKKELEKLASTASPARALMANWSACEDEHSCSTSARTTPSKLSLTACW